MQSNGSTTRTRRTSAHRPIPANVRVALTEVKAGLEELYGERLRGIYLYGSYARGDYRTDSDIDLLIVLADPLMRGLEIVRMNDVVASICLRDDMLISILPVTPETFANESELLFRFVRRDAVRL